MVTPQKGFHWIPAGAETDISCEIGLNYEVNHKEGRFRNYRIGDYHIYETPDRRITINYHPNRGTLNPKEFDYILNLCPYHNQRILNTQCSNVRYEANQSQTWVLATAMYSIPKNRYDDDRLRNAGIRLLGDSGGYSLKSFRDRINKSEVLTAEAEAKILTYLDARRVIEWQNAQCDAGFALDVPPHHMTDWNRGTVIHWLSLAQSENVKLMAKYARDDLQLLNVVQGSTLEDSRLWIRNVQHERFNAGWGVARNNRYDVNTGSLRNALIILEEYPTCPWVHIFGIMNHKYIPAFAWLGKYAYITTDSTNHSIVGSRYRGYYQVDFSGNHRSPLDLGPDKNCSAGKDKIYGFLPCSCPVCSAIVYADVLGYMQWGKPKDEQDSAIGKVLAWHNYFSLNRLVSHWNHLAHSLTKDEYKECIADEVDFDLVHIIDYIDCAINDGVDKAEKYFKDILQKKASKIISSKNEAFSGQDDFDFSDETSNLRLFGHFVNPDKSGVLTEEEKRVCRSELSKMYPEIYHVQRLRRIGSEEKRRKRILGW